MATQYTSLLGLALPVTGELSGSWGDVVNDSITSLLDAAVAGTTTLSTDGDVTLSTTTGASNQARQAILLCSGARTALRTITAPAQSKIYTVINATTGGFSVKVVGAGPTTGVTIVAGESAVIAWNGSDFVKVSNTGGSASFTNVTVSGTTTLSGLTASTALALDASKNVVSVTNTGTGNNVLATSPTLVTPALGTPSSATLTNATGLPISTGVSGLGTGIATALAVNVGSAGAPVINGGALGTPSSGTVTNLTGTASININGTVGATTPTTGAFTTLTTSSTVTLNGGTANGVAYLNGSKVLTTGSGFTFNGTALTIPSYLLVASSQTYLGDNGVIGGGSADGNTTLSYFGGKYLAFKEGSSEQMRLTSTGLGIGTSNPATKLVVSNAGALGIEFDPASGAMQVYNRSTSAYGTMNLWANTLYFRTGVSPAINMALDSSGNLGIGTSSPAVKLDVVGAGVFKLDGSGSTTPLILRNNNTASTQLVKLGFDSSGTIKASINAAVYGNDYMTFNVGSDTERMRIDSSGRVLVGTTSASGSNLLQVNSDALINGLTVGKGLASLTTNTAFGVSALAAVTTGSGNVALGYQALDANTTGQNNIAIGSNAIGANQTAQNLIAIGTNALVSATAGDNNIAIGASAMNGAVTGGNNVVVGASAMAANTSGAENTAVGYLAASSNTTGSFNTSLGRRALWGNTTTSNNVAVGYFALDDVLTGGNGTAVGYAALTAATGGSNTALGYNAGVAVTTGTFNLLLGTNAGAAITTGGKNVVIGSYQGNSGGLDIRTSSNYIVLSDGDANIRQVIDSSGNVGIGVIPSAWGSGFKALQLTYGGVYSQAFTVVGTASNSYNNGTNWLYYSTGQAVSRYEQSQGAHAWYNAVAGTAGNAISFTQAMTLDASGNLGIGNTAPDSRLRVLGATSGTGPASLRIGFNSTSVNYFDADTQYFRKGDGTGTVTIDSSGNVGIGTSSPGARLHLLQAGGARARFGDSQNTVAIGSIEEASDSAIGFFTQTSTERMRISSAGNVGLGVTPSAWGSTYRALQIAAGSGAVSSRTDAFRFFASTNAYNDNTNWRYGASTFASLYQQADGVHSWYYAPSGTAGNAISFTQAMTLDSSGNLLVGTTSTYGGPGRINVGFNQSTNFGLTFRNTSATATGVFVSFENSAGGGNGSISQTNSTTIAYNTSSDRRLKKDIVPAPQAGEDIDAIQVVSHGWVSNDDTVKYGVIAQDLQTVAPQAVSAGDDNQEIERTWGVDYSKLVPMLIKEVQALRARVAALEAA